jgi:hypothetical protein
MRCLFALPLLATLMLLPTGVTSASAAELKTQKQTCTATNCGATVLIGRINRSQRCCGFANISMPWVAQLYANPNECLRLHVTSQGSANTELVAIAPGTGRAWRNDSSNVSPCPTCPLLKIRTTTNENGWFLVQVNQTAGAAGDAEFVLRYARYAAGNPNCASPTGALPN